MGEINELTNQCIVALSSAGVQCRSIPLKTIKARFKSQICILFCVKQQQQHGTQFGFAFGAIGEQGKTMTDATRRLLETVNAVKDTGELLLQMIENHQKMLEMSRTVEILINDVQQK